MIFPLLAILAAIGLFVLIKRIRYYIAVKHFIRIACAECDANADVLCLNYRRLVSKTEYGSTDFDSMRTHIIAFLEKTVLRKTPDRVAKFVDDNVLYKTTFIVIDRILGIYLPEYDKRNTFVDEIPSHHKDFEHWCAERLSSYGWDATVSGKTGDQGADVIATRDGEKLVIQCKRYSKPVGNSAVQEIVASIAYYRADRGAVVSSSGFTTAAQTLARANGILLIDAASLARDAESGIFD